MSTALLGWGITLEMSTPAAPTVWTTIAECYSAAPPSDIDDQVDVTHYTSPNARREFIAGLTDGGEVVFEFNYVPGNPTDLFLIAAKAALRNIRITYFNGVVVTFQGLRKGYDITTPVDDKMTAAVTFKVTGTVTQVAGAVPVIVTVPAISGVMTVGQVLTAFPGVWTGAASYAYAWRREATPIAGATNPTYTLVAGDSTHSITLQVTASNSLGAGTPAISAGTTVVP